MPRSGFVAEGFALLRREAIEAGFRPIHTALAFSDADGNLLYDKSELVQPDGLHFNANGHRIWAERFLAEDGIGDD